MTTLFKKNNRKNARDSLREQLALVDRALQSCLSATSKANELLCQLKNERTQLQEKIQSIIKTKKIIISAELKRYRKQLAQVDCDLEYLQKNLQEKKPQQMVQRLQVHLQQLKEKEKMKQSKL